MKSETCSQFSRWVQCEFNVKTYWAVELRLTECVTESVDAVKK